MSPAKNLCADGQCLRDPRALCGQKTLYQPPPKYPYTFYKDPVGATNLVARQKFSVPAVSVYATYAPSVADEKPVLCPPTPYPRQNIPTSFTRTP